MEHGVIVKRFFSSWKVLMCFIRHSKATWNTKTLCEWKTRTTTK